MVKFIRRVILPILVLLALVALACVFIIAPTIQRVYANLFVGYTSTDGKFSVTMPGNPTEDSTQAGYHRVQSQVTDAVYGILYGDLTDGDKASLQASVDNTLAATVQSLISTSNRVQISTKSIQVSGYKAAQVIFTGTDSQNRLTQGQFTVFFTDSRMYMLMANYLKDSYSQENADKFVNSFVLTK